MPDQRCAVDLLLIGESIFLAANAAAASIQGQAGVQIGQLAVTNPRLYVGPELQGDESIAGESDDPVRLLGEGILFGEPELLANTTLRSDGHTVLISQSSAAVPAVKPGGWVLGKRVAGDDAEPAEPDIGVPLPEPDPFPPLEASVPPVRPVAFGTAVAPAQGRPDLNQYPNIKDWQVKWIDSRDPNAPNGSAHWPMGASLVGGYPPIAIPLRGPFGEAAQLGSQVRKLIGDHIVAGYPPLAENWQDELTDWMCAHRTGDFAAVVTTGNPASKGRQRYRAAPVPRITGPDRGVCRGRHRIPAAGGRVGTTAGDGQPAHHGADRPGQMARQADPAAAVEAAINGRRVPGLGAQIAVARSCQCH